jgi:hypothetical protein
LLSKQSDFKWERLHTEAGSSSIRLSEMVTTSLKLASFKGK